MGIKLHLQNHLHNLSVTRGFLKEAADGSSRKILSHYMNYMISPAFIRDYVRKGAIYKDFSSDVRIRNKFGWFNCGRKWWNVAAVSELFEPETEEFFDISRKKKNPVFVDVGANMGRYSVWMGRRGYQVYAFEPNPTILNLLKENITKNKIKNKAKIFPIALSSKEGSATLYLNENIVGHTSIEEKTSKSIKIKIKKLDSLKLKPDLIKIDVEGHDFEVLKGAYQTLKKYHPRIIIECGSKKSEIEKFLFKLNYKCKASELDGLNYVYE